MAVLRSAVSLRSDRSEEWRNLRGDRQDDFGISILNLRAVPGGTGELGRSSAVVVGTVSGRRILLVEGKDVEVSGANR
jgi:hypothetical protein